MAFIDADGTPFQKVGIGRSGLGYNRILHHERKGGVLVDVVHDTLAVCFGAEQAILSAGQLHRYRPMSLPSGGVTECLEAKFVVNLAVCVAALGGSL